MTRNSQLAHLLLLVFVFAIPWEEAIVLPGVGSVARLAGLLAALLTLLGMFRNGVLTLRRPSLMLILAAPYFALTVASVYWSIAPDATVEQARTLLQLLVMVWLVWQLCQEPARQRGLAQAFVLGGYVTAINILLNFIFQTDAIDIDGRVNAAGANLNDVATVMALTIPFAWSLLLHHRRGPLFWLNLLAIPVISAAVVLTSSRGGTIVLAVALLVVPLSYFQLRLRVQLTLLALLLALGAAGLVVPNRVLNRVTPNFLRLATIPEDLAAGNLTGRLVIWRAGFQELQQRPVLGFGAGTFRDVVRAVLGTGWAPHNTFLAIAVGTGLLGLTMFLLLLAVVLVPLLVPGGTRSPVPVVLFVALMIALLPLGWETHKATWFVLGYLASLRGVAVSRVGAVRAREATGARPRQVLEV